MFPANRQEGKRSSHSRPHEALGTHVGVAQLVLAIGSDAGDCGRPGGLGEARVCPVRPHAVVVACFWAVEETRSCREALVMSQRQMVDGGL